VGRHHRAGDVPDRRARAALIATALLLVLVACGDSTPATKDAAATTSSSPPTSTAASQPPTTSSPPTSSSPKTTAISSPQATAAPDKCGVGKQAPPSGDVPAAFATALAFAPDGRLFFAERAGTVRVWQDGKAKEFAKVSTVTTEPGGGYSERGLLGLAVSPTFATDRYVYAFYSDSDRSHQDIVRWTDCAGEGTDAKVIVQLPAGNDCCHKGGRLAFGTDGKLYVTLGDEHTSSAAQNTSDPRGKVLRYNPDGSVPGDNPFGGDNPVWASGFRNPFGIAFAPDGRLAVTVNGPTGDSGAPSTGYDTVSTHVGRGTAYQWATCYGYSHPLGGASCAGTEPEWSSEARTVVPTGAAFVSAAGPAPYAGHLVFCTLDLGMQVLTDASPHATVAQGEDGCRLDVKQGPDNALYFSDTDTIHRKG
jgi:glucose/arabinose dehydrogenase